MEGLLCSKKALVLVPVVPRNRRNETRIRTTLAVFGFEICLTSISRGICIEMRLCCSQNSFM